MTIKIGMIGLDTSHVSIFSKILHDPSHPYFIAGGQVVAAFPGGSPDFELSIGRVAGYTKEIAEGYGVRIVESPESVAERSDVIMLLSVDGRVHLEQFRRIAPYGKRVFIDKPFALTSEDAEEIVQLAEVHRVTLMSSSSLRYAESLTQELERSDEGAIIGVDCSGPLMIQPTQPGFFWYGIHCADMLYRVMGRGCESVSVSTTEQHDVLTAVWADGRIATLRGNRAGNNRFHILIHREKGSRFVDVMANPKPYYASLMDRIMEMFETGHVDVPIEETVEIVRFLEAANQARETGKTLLLAKRG